MHSVRFTAETSSNGVVERDFIAGEVPGVLWSPLSGPDHAPLVLMGHGGGLHKKTPAQKARAHDAVTTWGFNVVAIDAPGHGDRPRTDHDEAEIAELFRARAAGEPEGPIVVRYNARLAELSLPEWRAARTVLEHKFYFDELYDAIFYRPAVVLAATLRDGIENPLVLGSLGEIGAVVRKASSELREVQTGLVRTYALAIAGSVTVLAFVFVWVK